MRAELGLDRPAWQQLGDWLGDVVQLDLGRSLVTSRPGLVEVGYYLLGTLQSPRRRWGSRWGERRWARVFGCPGYGEHDQGNTGDLANAELFV